MVAVADGTGFEGKRLVAVVVAVDTDTHHSFDRCCYCYYHDCHHHLLQHILSPFEMDSDSVDDHPKIG